MRIAFLSKTEVNVRHLSEGLAPHPVTPCRSRGELIEKLGGSEVLVVQNQGFAHHTVDAECLQAGGALRLVQHHGVACDATDVEAATRLGIPVATMPGQNARSVAEHGFHLLLALARRARAGQRLLAEGRMGEVDCTELAGKTLCVVGVGTIGKLLAAMGRGFSMRVIGVRRNPEAENARAAGLDEVYGADRLCEALARADCIALVLPLNRETAGLVGDAAFRAMKQGALLVNLSRGPHVDRAALEAALAGNRIAGYATDAYWTEPADPADRLLRDERVVVTPHMGGKSIESIERTVRALRDNIERMARGEVPRHVVNPQVLERA